jgi:hypothetical protein
LTRGCAQFFRVTRGLDPRVHHLRKNFFAKRMDCRVKPGNDSESLDACPGCGAALIRDA